MKSALWFAFLLGCPPAKEVDPSPEETEETEETEDTEETDTGLDCVPTSDQEDCSTPEDDDCSGSTDAENAETCLSWFEDHDGDGFGSADDARCSCVIPDDGSDNDEDCNDEDDAISPDADELCNDVDDDCDGTPDDEPTDPIPYYADNDGDGFGQPAPAGYTCDLPEGASADNTDCDDDNADISPNRAEACDGIDNDCDENTADENSFSLYTDDSWTDWQLSSPILADLIDIVETSGGAIRACPGTYDESLSLVGFETPVVIASVEGSAATFWTADEAFYSSSGSSVRIEGFTFQNLIGPAISINNADEFAGSDLVFDGVTVGDGQTRAAAMHISNTDSVTLNDINVYNGNDTSSYPGIAITGSGTVTVQQGEFGNNAGTDSSLYVYNTDSIGLQDVYFFDNLHGALYFSDVLSVTGSTLTFTGNESDTGTAMKLYDLPSVTLEYVDCQENSADWGACIYAMESNISLTNCTLSNNTSTQWGGAVYANASTLSLDACVVNSNVAGGWGGGLRISTTNLTINSSSITSNTGSLGGGISAGSGSTLTTTNSSWGDATGNNSPQDIRWHNNVSYNYGDAATFSCTTSCP